MSLSAIGPVVLLGAGKMGTALARGWLAGGLPADRLLLVDPQPGPEAADLARDHGATLVPAAPASDGEGPAVLVLAVKPQIMGGLFATVRDAAGPRTLVLSIAAGIPLRALAEGAGTDRVVRTMPNTPAQVGKGITGAVAGAGVTADDRAHVEELMRAAGELIWFEDEAALDAVTAVSGSGPAYVFHLVEALAAAAERQGLAPDAAMTLARRTVIGAAALLEADPQPAAVLRQNVTSPGGTTAAALEVLMAEDGLGALIDRAVAAARRRSEELGRT